MSSTQHTQGRLDLRDESKFGGCGYVIRSADTSDEVAVGTGTSILTIEGNARRLVACWNALEGFATEDIEAGAIERLSSAALLADCGPSRLQQLVDALAKTETYLQERVAGNPGSRGATVILPMIRRAIEGAGVAPTQSTWADC